ncbi:chromate resistance protein ChrB domain-containing protein [Sulfitobacter donghicola]|uniref:Sulfurtransferase n=1 Tax=Sulfitobacter donghicola DSW-25 = KCTC 12864 = JCM 14565 TaxID=1300350 RepID=A0A073ICF1_9RHOB|nr:sulfurtransferase/chromate resistance protein [Sulfitobacter donghicola]KEJ87993.1 sulfurtransferase [Sulfitobacter donghicola DSW-25 = KCTC 12864 = JCM 14565]KIN69504.1 putative chromate resistance protein [Sulfitobacter donghicola DSW-25 = KCTC 12864 = JCM 14565]
MAAPNEITVSQLLRLIGLPDAPVIVDISIDPDFDADPFLIPSAFRHPHSDFDGLKARLAGRPSVIVCQKGIKLSQGMAAMLRAEGLKSEYLQGGNYGWRDHAGAPRLPAAAIPPKTGDATLWVTRHRPKIDRIACPWLIRRFVDANARVLFVSPAEVAGVADRYGATPFDVEDVFWSHRGDQCTFDTMLDEFGLHTPALDRLATVVRAADTNAHDLAPQAAGLLALSVGLSRQYRDDNQQLDAGMALYDALYRWARDGSSEGHDWPSERKS